MKARLSELKELLGQIEVLKTYYERLTDRERTIVVFTLAGVLLFVFLTTILIARTIAGNIEDQIGKQQENLETLSQLENKYSKMEAQVQQLEGMIRSTDSNFQLPTTLERIANKHSIQLESLKDRPAQPNELYKEIQTAVSIKEVNLRKLIEFLQEIETSPQLMRINTLAVRPNFKDPSLLNVDFLISTFQLRN